MTFQELYFINNAWEPTTILTMIHNTEEKLRADRARMKYGDYTVAILNVNRVYLTEDKGGGNK